VQTKGKEKMNLNILNSMKIEGQIFKVCLREFFTKVFQNMFFNKSKEIKTFLSFLLHVIKFNLLEIIRAFTAVVHLCECT
jgi:hypothetical protein